MAMFVSSAGVYGAGVLVGGGQRVCLPAASRAVGSSSSRRVVVSMGAFDSDLEEMSRRHLLQALGAVSLITITGVPLVNAEGEASAPPTETVNMSFGLSGVYKSDAESLVANMKTVTGFARGTPGMADNVAGVRKQMNDFVALYRRNTKVSGSSSFSTLYTSINTLSGHYQSYGNGYPVPEKRRKRLLAQYKDVERALEKGR